jgi:uncharacterized repeat protein (TIGR01451 family)
MRVTRFAIVATLSLFLLRATQGQLPTPHPTATHVYGQLPMYFERNVGQIDDRVEFIARGAGYSLFITRTETVAVLQKHRYLPARAVPSRIEVEPPTPADDGQPLVVRLQLAGANRQPIVEGDDLLNGKSNYFIGNDPSRWRTNVPHYRKVRLRNVYNGIDVVYYGSQRQLEYDFVVAPHADARQVRLRFEGAEQIDLDASGDLIIRAGGAAIRQRLPVVYQESGGGTRRPVRANYRRLSKREFGIAVAEYDAARPLVIDPSLSYTAELGGDSVEFALRLAVDGAGNVYVTGQTASINFPTANPLQAGKAGERDAFVTKLNASGSLVYSTYLGGAGNDSGTSIAVDSAGRAYVTGQTESTNFPVANPLQAANAGDADAFVAKLGATGDSLVYSTYVGGSRRDGAGDIAVDTLGSVYVVGSADSADFPRMNPFQATNAGRSDAYVMKLNAAGDAVVYASYLGGSGNDTAIAVAVDNFGNAYLTGVTTSTNFPTVNPFQATIANPATPDGFVAKVNVSGTALVYSTYLGGTNDDGPWSIAVDPTGNAYIAGATSSVDFPTANALRAHRAFFSYDGFVTKLNSSGSALIYSTYLGTDPGEDFAFGIAVDNSGHAYVAGSTTAAQFPSTGPPQANNAGGTDAYVVELDSSGSAFVFATYLGGTGNDYAHDIAIDPLGNVYIAGYTNSPDFPGAAQPARNLDAFVAKISVPDLVIAKSHTGNFMQLQTGATYTLTVSNIGIGQSAGTVTVTDTLPPGFTGTSMSGAGWICSVTGTPTCTRSDALAPGTSYPPITLAVNTSITTVGTFTNTATVSGGGELTTSNDTANDPTIVGLNPAAPALGPAALAVLALSLATIALFVLRRG